MKNLHHSMNDRIQNQRRQRRIDRARYNGIEAGKPVRALRLRVRDELVGFDDFLQGFCESNLERELGDFVLLRPSSGIYSYQLAVVVDDEEQGITHVVRGADLLDSTPRQIYLQGVLGYRQLSYMHIPVATGTDGEKLSKQTLAPALDGTAARSLLEHALRFLGQDPPEGLNQEELWIWANSNWNAAKIPRGLAYPAP
jgi:glutamyl-Q tRNA(Asp) synthetase